MLIQDCSCTKLHCYIWNSYVMWECKQFIEIKQTVILSILCNVINIVYCHLAGSMTSSSLAISLQTGLRQSASFIYTRGGLAAPPLEAIFQERIFERTIWLSLITKQTTRDWKSVKFFKVIHKSLLTPVTPIHSWNTELRSSFIWNNF